MTAPRATRRMMRVHDIAGSKVRNPLGEDLGKIEEIVLDTHTGQVAYAVLSFGGIMGMGDKLFAIPWQSLTTREGDFVLKVEKETLKNAPGFDKDHWPDAEDMAWLSEIYDFYGVSPYWR